MESMMDTAANVYMQTGFIGLFCIVVLFLVVWYFTKGRKESRQERDKLVKEQARGNQLIENCTAVINNNTKVIEQNTQTRLAEMSCIQKLDERLTRQGGQLDRLETNQTVCMDRQIRK